MRGPGDYGIRLLEVKGTFYNGVRVSASGEARLGHLTKACLPNGQRQYYVEIPEQEGVAAPWVPAGWERRILRTLSTSAAGEPLPEYRALS